MQQGTLVNTITPGRRSPMSYSFATLEQMGILARTKIGTSVFLFLNPLHPAERAIRAFTEAMSKNWEIPRSNLPPVSAGSLSQCMRPVRPPCTLFGYDQVSRGLLFIAAAGAANPNEISDMFGLDQPRDGLRVINYLVRKEFVVRVQGKNERPAILNENFFAAPEFRAILDALLGLHPEIATQVEKMRRFRPNRVYKENRGKPHIRG